MNRMKSIDDLNRDYLIYAVTRKGDTRELIKHLREGVEVTPEIKLLIADVLEGKIKAKLKPLKRIGIRTKSNLYTEIAMAEYILSYKSDYTQQEIESLLDKVGYTGGLPPEKKGDITKAKRLIAGYRLGLTPSQVSEIMEPRSARKKSR